MGYRSRLGRVKKTVKGRFAGLNYAQADMVNISECPLYRPDFHTELFELGKYFDQPEHLSDFYAFDVQAECESEFQILSKEGLKAIIEMYHNNIAMMYAEAAESKEKACAHIEGKVRTWVKQSYSRFGYLPYYLDEPEKNSDGMVAKSWAYEYAIFNLVHIYRTFDWDNDFLIYSAW